MCGKMNKMNNLKYFVLGTFLLLSSIGFGQITQVIRGVVVDQESQFPLIGVNVTIPMNGGSILGATTDENGEYNINNVPLGRQQIEFSYLGYNDVILTDIIVNSAKEVILNIEMQEKVTELDEVTVYAKRSGEVSNEMATVSAREFSVQETNRYAGSRGEPARMASNFAGVQGADDSRNDIIIRGNSPQGVLWRLDGFNIPNPNHFSIPGTGGGPVTILNNKFLANSDFFTGAFPAEYGNGIAGVFDLKMRNGNNQKHEFSGQLGFLGTELMAEGPISRNNKSSYLVTYRYSTLQLFDFLNINVGTDAIPQYQDGAFRLNFPSKNGGNIAVFGIGGLSRIDIILSEDTQVDTSTLIFGSNDRDQYFGSRMGIVGMTYTKPINVNTFIKAGVSASHSYVDANHDYFERSIVNNMYELDTLLPVLDYTFIENKYSAYAFGNFKMNRKLSVKAGFNFDVFDLNYQDQVRNIRPSPIGKETQFDPWTTRWDAREYTALIQPYVQAKYRMNDNFTLTSGLTSTYYSINNNSFSPIEPRLGLAYQIDPKQKLSLGLGVHSQIQSNYLYYYGNRLVENEVDTYNKGMGLTKSNHIVAGYDRNLASNIRLKFETYYQFLYNIPVEIESSSFSLINSGSGFSRFFPRELTNSGRGQNYGIEMTLEKFFTTGYYFLITGSVFDSKYKGSNDVWRNTTFNGNYAFNGLFAKEFNFGGKSSLNLGGKVTYAGGRRYGDVDEVASAAQLEIIYKDNDNYNAFLFRPYFRADGKVNYRFNSRNLTHELAIDFVNIFNTKNILTLTYAPDNPLGPIREEYQLGFLPLFYYRLDF